MVYPSSGSTATSPAVSMVDSGYASNFTSPIMSESQWTQASTSSAENTSRKPSSKKAGRTNDFSHLPGMKILTRDGRDVTNSASRGCKTKEQRDHAHLMRIIKACDSCRRKKIRCDPSHKRSTGSSSSKTARKTKKAAAPVAVAAISQQSAFEPSEQPPSLDLSDMISPSSFDSAIADPMMDPAMDWTQFVQFDEEPTEAIPYDFNYEFFFDPTSYPTPTSTLSNSNSFSPSLPITPAQALNVENAAAGTFEGEAQVPLPPYLNPGGEAGNDYADFNLYSPGSSTCLDDDPSLSKEIAAAPHKQSSRCLDRHRLSGSSTLESFANQGENHDTQQTVSVDSEYFVSLFSQEQVPPSVGLNRSSYSEEVSHRLAQAGDANNSDSEHIARIPEWHVPVSPGRLRPSPALSVGTGELQSQLSIPLFTAAGDVSPIPPVVSPFTLHESQPELSSHSHQENRRNLVATLTSGVGAWGSTPTTPTAAETLTTQLAAASQPSYVRHSAQHIVGYLRDCNYGPRLRLSQKPSILGNDESTSSLTTPKGCSTEEVSSSPSSTSSSSRSSQFVRANSENQPMSTSIARLDTVAKRTVSATSIRRPAFQGVSQQVTFPVGVPGRTIVSTPLSTTSEPVFSSGILGSALTATALFALPLLSSWETSQEQFSAGRSSLLDSPKPSLQQAKAALSDWSQKALVVACVLALTILMERLSYALGLLSFAVVHTTLRQQLSTPSVDMLDLAAQSLSFLKQLPATVTNGIRSTYTDMSEKVSRYGCNVGRLFPAQPSGQAAGRLSRLPCLANLA